MNQVKLETNHVTGVSAAAGGSGDPSPLTALSEYSMPSSRSKVPPKQIKFGGKSRLPCRVVEPLGGIFANC